MSVPGAIRHAKKVIDPRQPRASRDPLGKRGTGRRIFCMSCGGSMSIVGRVPRDTLISCPHCGFEQSPDD